MMAWVGQGVPQGGMGQEGSGSGLHQAGRSGMGQVGGDSGRRWHWRE